MDTKTREALFQEIDRLAPEYVQLWKELCLLEGRSDEIENLNRVADLIVERAEAIGFTVTREHFPGAGDPLFLTLPEKRSEDGQPVCGEFTSEAGPVSLLGHFDTVHPTGTFGTPAVTERDGKFFGPGVHDMKGGIALALFICDVLQRSGLPHREIRLVLDPDEESGEHLGENRKDFHLRRTKGSVAAINCESGVTGKITVGRKGVLRVAIDVTGIAGHAGIRYFQSASAIREAAYKILALEACSKEGGMTFNVGRIEGGTVVNIVPDHCHMEVDIRYLNPAQLEEAKANVDRVTKECKVPGCSAEWRILHVLDPMEETEGNHKLFDLYAETARETGLEEFSWQVTGGGSDAAFPVLLGIPTICSAGTVGSGAHTLQEEAETGSLSRRAKILTATILKI